MDLEQHLKHRYLDIALHRPFIDNTDGVVTFLLWNLSGQIVGLQTYRPTASKGRGNDPRLGRYFNRRKLPTVAVWGVESLHLTPSIVFVTEGIFDAARLTERGVSAVAVLSNDPSGDVYNWLHSTARTVIAVCDADTAGSRLAKFGHYAHFTETGKDLGEASDEFVTELLAKYVQSAV